MAIAPKKNVALPDKKSVTVKPVSVKAYTTKSGGVVMAHQAKHKVAEEGGKPSDKQKGDSVESSGNVTKPKKQSEKGVRQIETVDAPETFASGEHTSSVYTVKDDHGRTGYFKPNEGEVWQGERSIDPTRENGPTETVNFREGIKDDRLSARELVATDVSQILNMKDSIAQSEAVNITHQGKDFGTGTLTMDANDMLTHQGFTESQSRMGEATAHEWYEWRDNHQDMTADEFSHQRRTTALKNGGMDVAYFDFVIGNTDRQGGNLISGVDPIKSQQKVIGFDHGLSCPDTEKFQWSDYSNTLGGWWSEAMVHGSDVDCSDKFKKALGDPKSRDKLIGKLSKSKLNIEEQKGVLKRFDKIKTHLDKYGSLNGHGLKEILSDHFVGNKPEGITHPKDIQPYSSHGVQVLSNGPKDTKWDHVFSGLLDSDFMSEVNYSSLKGGASSRT